MTTLINKYIATHVASAIALVTLMLLGLQLFMLFVGEMGAIGEGSYTLGKAFLFVLMQLPYQVYLFFPIACLLGVLMGLGMLSNHSELLVIRACGISPKAVALIVFRVVGLLVVGVCVLGEVAFPKLTAFSEDWKGMHRSNGQALRTENGLWLRQNQSFIHIQNVLSNKVLKGVHQYRFNDAHELILSRFIKQARYIDKEWLLEEVSETHFPSHLSGIEKRKEPSSIITVSHNKTQRWKLNLSPNLLVVSDSDPNEMNLIKLGKLILAKRAEHLDAGQFEMNFWRRLFQPLATFIMVLLAMPFAFGSIRSVSVGQRFMLGSAVGFLFHLLNEFVIPISQIYQIPPLLAASLPMLFFAVLGAVLIARVN